MHVVTILIDPQSPDLALTVEVASQHATVRAVKEAICQQDLIGTATPESIRLCSAQSPGAALADGLQLSPALEPLLLRDSDGDEDAEAASPPAEAVAEVAACIPAEATGAAAPAVADAEPQKGAAEQWTGPLEAVLVEAEAAAACAGAGGAEEAGPLPEEASSPEAGALAGEALRMLEERAARQAQEDNDRRARVASGLKPAVRACWQKKWDQGLPSDYTFAVEDPQWVKYLRRHGFCVLRDVLPRADACEMLEGFWTEIAQVVPGLRREDPGTWDFPGNESTGITRGYGLPQSDFAWAVRGHPRIKRIFELVYRTDQLVVSMDSLKLVGTGVHEPGDFWLHRDQLKDVAPYSVQSIYTFYDVGPKNDGTILIPDSHKEWHAWDEWQRSAKGKITPMLRAHGRDRNNVRIPEELQEVFMSRAIKPRVPANGMILFCSRTIHASSPDAEVRWLREKATMDPPPQLPRPNRVAVSVSMCPRGRRSGQALMYKMTLVKSQCSTTHWADDEVLKGQSWGRDAGVNDSKFRVLPVPSLEHERERFRLL